MAFKVLTLLIFLSGCLSFKENSEALRSGSSSTYKNGSGFKGSLNLTKRKKLYIGDILSKYPNAKNITIVSGNRGSVSFHPNDLLGSSSVSVTYSSHYSILVTDGNQLIKIKKSK